MKGYIKLRKKALEILNTKLSKKYAYHGIHHTLDVLKVSNQYIRREKIAPPEAKLLRVGVLMHDLGFTESYIDHELQSVKIAEGLMSEFNFSKKDKTIVQGLILATQVPQKPKNKLEKIICDSDLDYLGRADFYLKSNLLFKELKALSKIENKLAWNKAQIKFLETHKYQTKFAKENRQPQKENRIKELKLLVSKKAS